MATTCDQCGYRSSEVCCFENPSCMVINVLVSRFFFVLSILHVPIVLAILLVTVEGWWRNSEKGKEDYSTCADFRRSKPGCD